MRASQVCAEAVVAALARAGVRHVVLCPGSRSAPLAYALADAERAGDVVVHVRTDERAAGFTALGVGRAGGSPAAVVTTSGTAVANLAPAVLEAYHGGVPLLVLSADRPHALRGTWANQTSELQAGLFGRAVRGCWDLAAPGEEEDETAAALAWAQAVGDAVDVALGAGPDGRDPGRDRGPQGQDDGGRAGPVQVDLAFADPLVPAPLVSPDPPPAAVPPDRSPAAVHLPATGVRLPGRARRRPAPGRELAGLPPGPRTVVVAGDAPPASGWVGRWVAEAGGWPLLAEPTSGSRSGPAAVAAYRLLLGEPGLGERVERVVVTGRPTLTRPVARLLADPGVEVVQVLDRPGDPGPAPRPGLRRVHGAVVPEAVLAAPKGWYAQRALAPDAWLSAWLRAGAVAHETVGQVLDERARAGVLTGPLLGREVAAATAAEEVLVLAASNAVRDVDLAAAPFVDPVLDAQRSSCPPALRPADARLVLAGRGLAGIDGTLSGAVGAALATGRRVRALVGDLAFLHDLAGLAVPADERAREGSPQVQVVVLDDGGGGIFATLEHGGLAARAADVERLFGTPTGADLVALARGLGVPARRVGDLAELRAELAAPRPGLSVLVVPADRSGLRDLHASLEDAVRRALGAEGPAFSGG